MSKLTLTLLLISMGYSSAQAQFFKAGVIGGFNFSQIEGDHYNRSHLFDGFNKFGFIVGGFSNATLSKIAVVQFEIYYINKGSFNSTDPNTIYYEQFSLATNYLEIPLLIRLGASSLTKENRFKFEGGIYYARLLNFHIEDQYGEVSKYYYDLFNQHPIRAHDMGFLIGVHYQLSQPIALNYRIKSSLTPIRTINNSLSVHQQNWYNYEINLSVRYQFGE